MKTDHQIIIADRSRHLRDFLKREFNQSGYRVSLARDGKELIRLLQESAPGALLIVDPDFPDIGGSIILTNISNQYPRLPVILHVHQAETPTGVVINDRFHCVEKRGNSVEILKRTVFDILQSKTGLS